MACNALAQPIWQTPLVCKTLLGLRLEEATLTFLSIPMVNYALFHPIPQYGTCPRPCVSHCVVPATQWSVTLTGLGTEYQLIMCFSYLPKACPRPGGQLPFMFLPKPNVTTYPSIQGQHQMPSPQASNTQLSPSSTLLCTLTELCLLRAGARCPIRKRRAPCIQVKPGECTLSGFHALN